MSKKVMANRQARLMAVQALYQQQFRGQTAAQVLEDFLGGFLTPNTDRALFVALVEKTIAERDTLDGLIAPRLSGNWRLERLDPVLLALLRVGTAELWRMPETPAKIIIFDYVTLAKAFFDQREPAFVNQILDLLARELRPGELPERSLV
jgi:N utilization substance protein B